MDTDHSSKPSSTVTAGISRRAALGRLAGAGVTTALLVAARHTDGQAQATPEAESKAARHFNHFVLGNGETQIVYDTTGFAGEPQLTYRGPIGSGPVDERPIDSFTIVGDEIHTEQVRYLGQLVTVYLDAMPDAAVFYVTLLLPDVLPSKQERGPTSFATLAILTTFHSPSFGAPALIAEYAAVELEGTAAFVIS